MTNIRYAPPPLKPYKFPWNGLKIQIPQLKSIKSELQSGPTDFAANQLDEKNEKDCSTHWQRNI